MQRRHLQTVATLLAALAGGAIVQLIATQVQPAIAQPAPAQLPDSTATLRAKQVILVDDNGKERIRLDANSGNVTVTDAQSTSTISIGFFKDGIGLQVESPAGHSIFGGGATPDDGLGMGVWGPNAKLRFGLGWQPKGNGGIVINDEFGAERASLGMPAGAPGVSCTIKDRAGRVLFSAP